jgi:hypothetical protein
MKTGESQNGDGQGPSTNMRAVESGLIEEADDFADRDSGEAHESGCPTTSYRAQRVCADPD